MRIFSCSARSRAFTRIELLVVIAVLALLAVLFLSAFAKAKSSRRIRCRNHLKQVALGFAVWAGDNGSQFPMQVSVTNGGTMEAVPSGFVFPHFQVMSNELNTPKILHCPDDTAHTNAFTFTSDFTDWKISYFVGVDARLDKSQSVLTGDANLLVNGVPANGGLLNIPSGAPISWSTNRHRDGGNVALADGSVQFFTSRQLQPRLRQDAMITNRFAIPR